VKGEKKERHRRFHHHSGILAEEKGREGGEKSYPASETVAKRGKGKQILIFSRRKKGIQAVSWFPKLKEERKRKKGCHARGVGRQKNCRNRCVSGAYGGKGSKSAFSGRGGRGKGN